MFAHRLPVLMLFALAVTSAAFVSQSAVQAADAVDLSKLKPGDKLELKWAGKWYDAVVVKQMSGVHVMVRREDNCQEMAAPSDWLRLPDRNTPKSAAKAKSKAKAKPADAAAESDEELFATDEEKAAARQPRTWTDRAGKSKTDATLLRVEDEQVVLLRKKDDKEIKVPLAKLSDDDQKYVAQISGAPVAPDDEEQDAGPTRLPITPTDITKAKSVHLEADAQWTYRVDGAARQSKLNPTKIPLKGEGNFEPAQLIFQPTSGKAFVVDTDSHSDFKKIVSRVRACDLRDGKVESAEMFGVGVAPLDMAPDATLVLAQNEVRHGSDGHTELQIHSQNGSKFEPLKAWLPYGHHVSPLRKNEKSNRPALDSKAVVVWARFIDASHVASLSAAGELALWEVPDVKLVYSADGGHGAMASLSGGRKYIALSTGKKIAIIEAMTGSVAGTIDTPTDGYGRGRVAFRSDGRRLALVQNTNRVRVWDLETQKLTRDFAVLGAHLTLHAQLEWIGDEYLLLDGATVIDVSRRVAVWNYSHGMHDICKIQDGLRWSINKSVGRGEYVLSSDVAPPKQAIDALLRAREEDLLVIQPGMKVAVELQAQGPDSEATRQAIVTRLNDEGMQVVPQSEVRLVGSIRPGETKTIQYRPLGGGLRARGAPMTQHQVSEQIMTLSWMIGNDVVWKHEGRTSPPTLLRHKKDESVDQALSRSMQLDPKSFAHIWVPVYVAQHPHPAAMSAPQAKGP